MHRIRANSGFVTHIFCDILIYMVVHVQKVGNELVLPPQAVQELGLVEGSAIEVTRAENAPTPTIRYASVAEVMEVHRKMEPRHAAAYAELAK